MPCRNPCKLYIHFALVHYKFHWSLKRSVKWPSLILCGVVSDTILVPNLGDGLKNIKTSFSLARILNIGRIGLIRWIMNISTLRPWNVSLFHYTFPSKMSGLEIGSHRFTYDKVGLDWGHNAQKAEVVQVCFTLRLRDQRSMWMQMDVKSTWIPT